MNDKKHESVSNKEIIDKYLILKGAYDLGDRQVKNSYTNNEKIWSITINLRDSFIDEYRIVSDHYNLIIKSLLNIFTVILTFLAAILGFENIFIFNYKNLVIIIIISLLLIILISVIVILWLLRKRLKEIEPVMDLTKSTALSIIKSTMSAMKLS